MHHKFHVRALHQISSDDYPEPAYDVYLSTPNDGDFYSRDLYDTEDEAYAALRIFEGTPLNAVLPLFSTMTPAKA